MRILYVFPHPDDESFGPGAAMAKQAREGREVFLLTLTRGGATKRRRDLGLSVADMGEVRKKEMEDVARILKLAGLEVLDLPDSGLKDIDPREVERAVAEHVARLEPQVVVTYPVHGVSGFPDHLVTHAAVKRAFCAGELRGVKRLAFFTLREVPQGGPFRLTASAPEDVDCVVHAAAEDLARAKKALLAYRTYLPVIERTGILDHLTADVAFEIFGERHAPPLDDLFAAL